MARREKFGRLMRAGRKKAGYTMADLADYLGLKSVSYISDVERGNRPPFDRETREVVAEFLGIDPDKTHVAAAESKGAFELDPEVSNEHREVGAALMRGWADLGPEELRQIAKVLNGSSRRK